MLAITLAATLISLTSAIACAEHNYHAAGRKRAGETSGVAWDYDLTRDWGRLSPEFATCQHGTMQAPIPLRIDQGMAYNHIPNFSAYDVSAPGTLSNWGFGPAMTLAHPEGQFTGLPSFSFDEGGKNESLFLTGWHIHAPSDHTVDGIHSKAEMHLVHVNTEGTPRAVLAIRIACGHTPSPYFAQMPQPISYRDANKTVEGSMNPMMAVKEAGSFEQFWTYQGSLTTPPCSEGLRFFMARHVLHTDIDQMRHLLAASKYSAREPQQVWQHQINV